MKNKLFAKPKRKTIKQLETTIKNLENNLDTADHAYNKLCVERDDARKEAQTFRNQFADLKERLLNAEKEVSRLNGYLARVHEDDIVRDGMIEIEDGQGKRQVPKRPPPMMHNVIENFEQFNSPSYLNYGSEKKTHWTSY